MINEKIELLNECNIRYLIKDENLYVNIKDTESYLGTALCPTEYNTKCFYEKVLYFEEQGKVVRYFKFEDWINFFTSYDINVDVKFLRLFENIDLFNKFNITVIDFLKNNNNIFTYIIKDGLICLTLGKICEYFSFTSLNKNNGMYGKYITNTPFRRINYIKPEGFVLLLINCLKRYEYICLFTNPPNEIIKKEFINKGVDVVVYNNILHYYIPHVLNLLDTYDTYFPLIKNNIIKTEDISKINRGIYFTENTIFKIITSLNSLICFDMCKRNSIQHNLTRRFSHISIEEININEETIRILKCDDKKYYKNCHVYKYFGKDMKVTEDKDSLLFYDNYYNKPLMNYLSEDYIKIKLYKTFKKYKNFYDKQKIVKLNNEFGFNIDFKCKYLNNINTIGNNETLFKKLTNLNNVSFDKMLSVTYGVNNDNVYILIENDIYELIKKYSGYYPIQFDIFMSPNNELIRSISFDLFLSFLPRLKNDLATQYINELGLYNSYFKLFESYTFPIIESTFPNIKFEKQYIIKRSEKLCYYLDLAIPSYKICIECDENGHMNYDKKKELTRENYLLKNGWKILRYNPQSPETIGSVICELYKSFQSDL